MIKIDNVTKRYGSKLAADHISFEINKGEVLGLLGPNGAGKSTTMNIITGYLSASEGTVLLDGRDILDEPRYVKRRIGYLPEQPPLYQDMTVDEYLKFVCAIKEVNKNSVTAHLETICGLVRISEVRKRLIKNLSKGFRQRVGIAQALVGNPDVIILDEPTIGLDPMEIIEIRTLIKKLGSEHTLVLSSHILTEVSDVCDRVVIIDEGRVKAVDTLANLTAGDSGVSRMTARVAGPEERVRRAIIEIEGVLDVRSLGTKEPESIDWLIESDHKKDIRKRMFVKLAELNAPLLLLRPMDMSLEDIFIKITSGSEVA